MKQTADTEPKFVPVLLGFWVGALAGAALMYANFGMILCNTSWDTLRAALQPEYSSPRDFARKELTIVVGATLVGLFVGSAVGGWAAHRWPRGRRSGVEAQP
jgi:heme A synthase